jgi:hypothetical protein
MLPFGNVDMCSVCKHTIRVANTTELWLDNLAKGEVIYIKGERFEKIESAQGTLYWQHEAGPWYKTRSMLDTFGTVAEVRCAS